MATIQNLIPGNTPDGHKLTLEEQKAGGRASAKARKRQKTLKEMCELFASLKPNDPRIIEQMKKEGLADEDITRGALIARNIVIGAGNQDHRAVAEYMDATGQRLNMNINQNINIEPPAPRLAKDESEKNAGVDGHDSLLQNQETV